MSGRRLAWVCCLLWVASVTAWGQWADEGQIVQQIEIRFVGPATVNRAVVLANIQTKEGQPLARRLVEQDVRDLIATGFFTDVRVLREPVANGVKVIYQLQGKATIQQIVLEGVKAFKPDRVKREISFKDGDIYDERQAHLDAQKITQLYHKYGYPDVKVTSSADLDRDTGRAIVRFHVEEGPRVFIRRVQFHGVKEIPVKQLYKLMKTRHRWWLSWISGTGVLKDDQFREDLDTLREYYLKQGYLDAAITETQIERVAPNAMVVHIHIFEGQRYQVGEIKFEGNTLFTAEELRKRLKMTTGQYFTPGGLRDDLKALEDAYGAKGYLDTQVRSTRTPNVETGRLDLTYTIREGELNYIDKIEIRGNTKTKDKVIRRELAVVPGEVFDMVRVEKSAERLRNLGYFSKVETLPSVTPVPNRKDLVITVEEQRTGTLTFGAGFSSVDNLIGFIEVTQGNFDLFNWPTFTGGGQKLRLRIQLGFERQDYVLSFVEPWFLDQKLALGVDFFHREAQFLSDEFDETRTGGNLRLEKALTEFWRGRVQYSIQRIELDVATTASAEIRSQDGTSLRSSVEFGLIYDSRDSLFLTTRGNRTELSAELVGGPFGGDVSVYKLNARTSFYFPFFNNHVLQLVGAAGVVEAFGATKGDGPYVIEPLTLQVVKVNDVPIYDRYFLGGPNTLRGFRFRDVSPRDVRGEPVGGNTYAHATVEYTFPIVERVRGAVFYDIGSVWRDSYEFDFDQIRSDVGVGIRLNLPIGPLRLDYGYPIQTVKGDSRSGKIQFSVGYQF